jgi:four helix bundle protein
MGARNHRELVAWQLADELRKLIYRATSTGRASQDFRFRDEIRDSVSSACRNTAEGFYRSTRPQFAYFLNVARGSLGETLDQIDDGRERDYFNAETCGEMLDLCNRAMIANLRLRQSLTEK